MDLNKLLNDLELTNPLNKQLLEEAFTHSSYANEHHTKSNERLEYLGDAVLELCMSTYLYHNLKEDEGVLTIKRAQAVREEALNIYAEKINLNAHLLLGKGEEKSGGRTNKAIIADAFEAMLGAIYLTYGFSETYRVFSKLIIPYLDEAFSIKDYKSIFQEEIQSEKRNIRYEIISETGPTHDRVFEAVVYIDDLLYGHGIGKTKKEAEQMAAKEALLKRAK